MMDGGLTRIRPAGIRLTPPTRPRSRLRWLADRAGAMDAAEVRQRLSQVSKVIADVVRDDRLTAVNRRESSRGFDPSLPALILTRGRARSLRRLVPAPIPAVLDAAERVAAGEFQLLGYPPVQLQRPLSFERDPHTGREWPQRHGLLLDYRTAQVGDPKWTWELNRLQHIPLLFSAALLADEDRFVDVAVSDLEAWLKQARIGRGIAWSNGYEPALRAISLALSLDALRELGAGSSRLRVELVDSLGRHVAWVLRYPSLSSSANNHRIGELAGVVVAATLAPELGLDAQLDHALSELRARCDEQFAPDGGHREQSFGYCIFSLELLLAVAGALSCSGERMALWLESVQARALDALDLQLADGDPEPRYGDRDDGGPTLLGGRRGRTGRATRASLAYSLRGERAADLEPSAIWLFGERQLVRSKVSAMPRKSGWMRESGIVVLRAGETSVTFDIGALGYRPLAAHGHADALHVTLSHAGVLLVGDPGTGSYFGSAAVRDAFRSTRFHATVVVDGLDQAVAAGPFLWTRAPDVEVSLVDVEAGTASAGHTGYQRLDDPVSHRRIVSVLGEGLLLVRDVLTARGAHRYSQRWPLPPAAVVVKEAAGRVRGHIDGVGLVMSCHCSAASELKVYEGSLDPFEGWWSSGLESIEPAPLIACDASAVGDVEFVTLLAAGAAASQDVEELVRRDGFVESIRLPEAVR